MMMRWRSSVHAIRHIEVNQHITPKPSFSHPKLLIRPRASDIDGDLSLKESQGKEEKTPIRSYSLHYKQINQLEDRGTSTSASEHAMPNEEVTPASTSNRLARDQATQTEDAAADESDGIGFSSIREEAVKLKEALARAQNALKQAESSLESLETLPSAQPLSPLLPPFFLSRIPYNIISTLGLVGFVASASTPGTTVHSLFYLIQTSCLVMAMGAALVASHAFGIVVQWIFAAVGGISVAAWGLQKGSLSRSGAIAAAAVGGITLGCSMRFGATLLAFFFSSSKLTQYKQEVKESIDDQAKKGGQRDWIQVSLNCPHHPFHDLSPIPLCNQHINHQRCFATPYYRLSLRLHTDTSWAAWTCPSALWPATLLSHGGLKLPLP